MNIEHVLIFCVVTTLSFIVCVAIHDMISAAYSVVYQLLGVLSGHSKKARNNPSFLSIGPKIFVNPTFSDNLPKLSELKTIGICGAAGSGKDTVAKMLQDKWTQVLSGCAQDIPIRAYAAPLKQMGETFFTHEQLFMLDGKETIDDYWKISPREFLCKAGDWLPKVFGPHWGVSYMRHWRQTHNVDRLIISDARNRHECEYVHKTGIVIEVVRPLGPRSSAQHHWTEQQIPNDCIHIRIINDEDLLSLQRSCDAVIAALQ